MSDGAFSDRVTLLRSRWEADPSSRIFLQLAEEYRHQGRVKEALDVLDRGLKEHPGYLSALVAKGRCHLELGEPEPAKAVLGRVVKQDATQMVANKLLVRAHLETGEPERARERLDLYSLLNDSDPEIEELRRRLRAMEQPPQAGKPGSTPPSDHGRPEAPFLGREAAPAGGDIFDLGFPAPRVVAVSPEEPFADLLAAAPAAAAAVAPSPAAVAAAAPEPAEEPEPEDVLFPGLAGRESRQRYLDRLGSEGIFLLDLTPWESSLAPPHEPAVAEEEEEAPVFDLAERTPWAEEPAPLEAEPPAAPAVAAEPMATATLGEIYLKQGHHGEAERMFREVLRREPENAAAREGLARAAGRRSERRPLEVRDLLASYEPVAAGGEAETRARKAWVLKGYLQRLRQGSQRDVS
jgi:tetratricopeptide (TPR) repeat protein